MGGDMIRNITLSDQQILAVLSGRCHAMRMPINPQPKYEFATKVRELQTGMIGALFTDVHTKPEMGQVVFPVKLGAPGDILRVREYHQLPYASRNTPFAIAYRATGVSFTSKWRTPQTMPHKFVRIYLQITEIYVTKLHHSLCEDEAWAMGAFKAYETVGGVLFPRKDSVISGSGSYLVGYKSMWEEMYGSWDENPWVWHVKFQKIKREK